MGRYLTGLIAITLLLGCQANDTGAAENADAGRLSADIPELQAFPGRLTEADAAEPEAVQRPPQADPTPLDTPAIQTLLSRLPPLAFDGADQQDFVRPQPSEPPPRPESITKSSFPPEDAGQAPPAESPAEEPLQVLRHAPEGEVEMAARISLSFDRPMVALGTQAQTVAVSQPVQMQPEVPGTWRWAGSRSLIFEPDAARLPMATEFRLTVPAGTQAADGSVLEGDYQWQFVTPPLELVRLSPSGQSVELEPDIFLLFNQRINAAEVAKYLRLLAGEDELAYELILPERIEPGSELARQVDNLPEQRWLALRALQPLPGDSRITVRLERGAPSAEGPLLTSANQSRSFNTYGPLELQRSVCGYRHQSDRCRPGDPLFLHFSNPLQADQELEALIDIQPEVPGLRIELQSGNSIRLVGFKPGGRRYSVTVAEELKDRFGQTLAEPASVDFEVDHSDARVLSSNQRMVTLDPAAPPVFDVFSLNYRDLKVRVFKVEPADWRSFLQFSSQVRWGRRSAKEMLEHFEPKLIASKRVPVSAEMDDLARTGIDLQPHLAGSPHGQFVVMVQAGEAMPGVAVPDWQPMELVWVQVSDVGLDVSAEIGGFLVWATDLADGSPLVDYVVELPSGDTGARTDDQGLARIDFSGGGDAYWLSVHGESRSGSLFGLSRDFIRGTRQLWYVTDDRGIYRPGEQVHIKGWQRLAEIRPDGGLELPDIETPISFSVLDGRGNTLVEGETDLSEYGGFDFAFDLPDNAHLGNARVMLGYPRGSRGPRDYTHHFQIEAFRTPEFEVSTAVIGEQHMAGETVSLSLAASYYAGGPLPSADVRWFVTAEHGRYTPPNRSDWSFGIERPRTWFRWPGPETGSVNDSLRSVTDASGSHYLDIDLEPGNGLPLSIQAQGTVEDMNRQAWSSSSRFLTHSASHYVGLRSQGYFVERGQPLRVETLVADIDGEAVAGSQVLVEAAPVSHQWRDGEYTARLGRVQRCQLLSDADGLGECEFTTEVGGQYRITAEVLDDQGRRNISRMLRWVSGGRSPSQPGVGVEDVTMIPQQETLAPGDTARILLEAPFENAEGLLTLRRHGIAEQQRFRIDGSSITLEVPIRREWMPNIEAHVLLLGSSQREGDDAGELPPRPALAAGSLNLEISVSEQRLVLEVAPDQSHYAPGDPVQVDARVLDADGTPVAGAELALIVVDEAVLALSDFQLGDPIEVFFAPRDAGVRDFHSRPYLRLTDPEELAAIEDEQVSYRARLGAVAMAESEQLERIQVTGSRVMGDASSAEPGIVVRQDFTPLAAFKPALISDQQGRVQASFNLPDNLSRYRIMAVAAEGADRFGKAESTLTARLPLVVRPSPPRFLNFGDAFEFPVLLQNQTEQPLQVELAMDASNLALSGAHGYSVEVPARQRVELRFPAAAEQAGTARYQIAASAGDFSDAAGGSLPVWTPATGEAFASYGEIDQGGISQPVAIPEAVWPQFGQLELTTSSTAVHSLTDAYLYLKEYPFHCSEQVASRILGTVALHDVLQAFDAADLPSSEEVDKAMRRDLERLSELQGRDGGFPLWRRFDQNWPYASVHVGHALLRAQQAGYPAQEAVLQRALGYLRNIEQHLPERYPERARWHIQAYALYVRALAKEPESELLREARQLYQAAGSADKLSFETIGWLISLFSQFDQQADELSVLRRYLSNRVSETAATASFGRDFERDGYLVMHSSRRADAVLLDALLQDQPDSDLITKLVRGLQAHRSNGRWRNTQENAFVLLALRRYFDAFESVTPDFVARTWLGDQFAGEHAFSGRSTEAWQLAIPMQWLLDQQDNLDLQLHKDGPGRLYYRLGLRYAPKSLRLDAANHGFEVDRVYRALDNPDDVLRTEDGNWQIRAGARVAVDITLVAPARRYHVALIDPLPAGLEPINPALAVSEQIQDDDAPASSRGGWWWHQWYQHQNLRDERAEAFTTLLPGGVYHYSYHARATTPGEFVVPPARAEEMYHPETFGRSGTTRVRVVD